LVRVYIDETADLNRYKRVGFLKKAHALGDYLPVDIYSDEAVHINKRRPTSNMDEAARSSMQRRWSTEARPYAPSTINCAWIKKRDIDRVAHDDGCAQDRLEYTCKASISMEIFSIVPGAPGISTQELGRVWQRKPDR